MYSIFLYDKFNKGALATGGRSLTQKFDELIVDLKENKYTNLGDVKLIKGDGGVKYFRAKLSHADRLLFTGIKYKKEDAFVILEIVLNHEYDKSKFLKDKEKIKSIKIIEYGKKISDNVEIEDAPKIHLLGKFITFSAKQESIIENAENLPLIVSGHAGSGKTSVALEKLRKIEEKFEEGKILYITQSENLIKQSKELYEYEYWNEVAEELRIGVPERIDFLSVHEFFEKATKEEIKGKKAIGRNVFHSWFKEECNKDKFRKYKKEVDKIFEEFIAVIAGGGLDKNEYKKLGRKQSIFPADQREDVYVLFQRYKEFIEGSPEYYDTSLIANECVEKIDKVYDAVIVDEVQDLTRSTLARILESLKDDSKGNFLLCGDVNQVIHPSFFSISKLKYFLSNIVEKKEVEVCVLEKNYRNGKQVIESANRILHFKNYYFASEDKIKPNEKEIFFMKSGSNDKGTVVFINESEKQQEIGKKASRSVNWAVLVLDDGNKEDVRKSFGTSLVFSVQEVKGLEFKNVILYKFSESYNKLWNVICPSKNEKEFEEKVNEIRLSYGEESINTSRPKDKEDESFERNKFYINALYVAVTRAIDGVYIMDDKERYNLLKVIEPGKKIKVDTVDITRSSPEEWRDMALDLINKGKIEQAKSIAKKLLDKEEYVLEIKDSLRAKGWNKEVEEINAKLHDSLETKVSTGGPTPKNLYDDAVKSATSAKKTQNRGTKAKKCKAKRSQNRGNEKQLLEKNHHLVSIIREDILSSFEKIDISQYGEQDILKLALKTQKLSIAEHLLKSKNKGFTYEDYSQLLNDYSNNNELSNLLYRAAMYGRKNVVKLVLKHGRNVNAKNSYGCIPLHIAAQEGHKDVVDLLIKHGANVNAETRDGCTPLHMAAGKGRKDIVDFLIKHGASVNAKNSYGCTPLFFAAQEGKYDTIDFLLDHKANVNVKTSYGCTPLHIAAQGDYKDLVDLLIKHGADVNAQSEQQGTTSLHIAVEKGYEDVVKLLVKNGADVNAKTQKDVTPLFFAAQKGHEYIVRLLLICGANVNVKTQEGITPLHLAAQRGFKGIVELLLDRGVDVNAKTREGITPLTSVMKDGDSEVVDLLLSAPNINVGYVQVVSAKKREDKEKILQKLNQDNKLFNAVEQTIEGVDENKVDKLLEEIKELLKSKSGGNFKPSLNYSPYGTDKGTTLKVALEAGNKKLLKLLYDYAEKNVGVGTEIFKQLKRAVEQKEPQNNLYNASVSNHSAQTQTLN